MIPISFRTKSPDVFVVGHSQPVQAGLTGYLLERGIEWHTDAKHTPATLSEFGGRICYGASSFKNPRESTQAKYLRTSIIDHGHESVIEHVTINFAVAGLSRNVLQELARHRVGVAYSVRSTRFADDQMEFAIPPLVRGTEQEDSFKRVCELAVGQYESTVEAIKLEGLPKTLEKKRKREAARNILPGALTCDLLFTCNARALRHIIQLRTNEHADLSFREFAYNLFDEAHNVIPELLVGAKVRHVGGAFEVDFT